MVIITMLQFDEKFNEALKESLAFGLKEDTNRFKKKVRATPRKEDCAEMLVVSYVNMWQDFLEDEFGDVAHLISMDRRLPNIGEYDTSDIEQYIFDELEEDAITLDGIKKFFAEKAKGFTAYMVNLYEHTLFAVSLEPLDDFTDKKRNVAKDYHEFDMTRGSGILLLSDKLSKEQHLIMGELLEDGLNGTGCYELQFVYVDPKNPKKVHHEGDSGMVEYIPQDIRWQAKKIAKEYGNKETKFVKMPHGEIVEL